VEVSGQLCTPFSLSQLKELFITTTEQEAGWSPEPVPTLLRTENPLSLPEINPVHPADSIIIVRMLQFELDKLTFSV
jgi:hypothetical protein